MHTFGLYCASRRFAAVVAVAGVSGCAVVQPQIPPHAYGTGTGSDYGAALSQANALRTELASRTRQLELFDFWSGFGLLGVGIAGLAFGVFEASRTAVLATAVGGAGLLGIRTFVPIAVRKQALIDGQAAVNCAVAVTSFGPTSSAASTDRGGLPPPVLAGGTSTGSPTDPSTFFALARQAGTLAEKLPPAVAAPAEGSGRDAGSLRGMVQATVAAQQLNQVFADLTAAADESRAALAGVGDALAAADQNRARRLDVALAAIVDAVNRQMALNGVDPAAALAAARGGVTPNLDAIQKNVEQAKAALRKLDDNKRKANQVRSSAAAPDTVAAAPAIEAQIDQVQQAVDQASELTDQAQPKLQGLDQILNSLELPAGCFDGLS